MVSKKSIDCGDVLYVNVSDECTLFSSSSSSVCDSVQMVRMSSIYLSHARGKGLSLVRRCVRKCSSISAM